MLDLTNIIRPMRNSLTSAPMVSLWPAAADARAEARARIGNKFLYRGGVIELTAIGRYFPSTPRYNAGFQVFFKEVIIENRRREAVAHQRALNKL